MDDLNKDEHIRRQSAKIIDDALRVFKSEEYSRFQNFDDALDALTRRLYEGEYYNTPNSSICILYNLELHRFQTFASSSLSSFQYSDAYTRTDDENNKTRYPSTTITIIEIKTNQNEFDDYIEKIINKHTYTLEDLTKDEYRKLIIDYLVHLQMEKIQLNPLEIAANHEIQTRDVKSLISKLQYAPQKSDKVALLLEGVCDFPPGIARLVARNICLDIPKVWLPKKCTSKGQNRLSGVKEIRTIQTFTSILSVAQQYH